MFPIHFGVASSIIIEEKCPVSSKMYAIVCKLVGMSAVHVAGKRPRAESEEVMGSSKHWRVTTEGFYPRACAQQL